MSDGALDGKVISEIGVSMAVERLLRAGFRVAIPIVDEGFDLLAFSGHRYWRIQVKSSASRVGGANSSRVRIRRGRRRYQYSPKDIDAFIAVNTRTGAVMCVPVRDAAGRAWINWSQADKWTDMGVLRRIKQQRC
jgi:hypothetical protein